jgi:hypothetical protein
LPRASNGSERSDDSNRVSMAPILCSAHALAAAQTTFCASAPLT